MLPIKDEEADPLESISSLIGLDVEKKALELIAIKSPEGHSKRQIAKVLNPSTFEFSSSAKKQESVLINITTTTTTTLVDRSKFAPPSPLTEGVTSTISNKTSSY